jgi:hypothetical protein
MSEQFVVLVRDFPVSVDDEDARMLAYLVWCIELAKYHGIPVSRKADLDIREMIAEGDIQMVRILGLAERE